MVEVSFVLDFRELYRRSAASLTVIFFSFRRDIF
jgi:hypothetical protein